MRPSKALLPLILATLLGAEAASAQSASELFEEGNALARSGVYRTALMRYREAIAAGLDTPLLHFNVAVVNYRLGEFETAAREFATAAADPALSSLARFNQELAARAAAESSTTLDTGRPAARTPVRTAVPDRSPGRGGFELAAAARLGTDDNVYRAPAAPYADLSVAGQPVVTPEPQSASFMPVELAAAYVIGNESGDTAFRIGYDLDGDFYDTAFTNASRVDQRLSMGADIVLGERERRRRAVETSFYARTHRQGNFDPDDGLDRDITVLVGGVPVVEDIGDRFSFKAAGIDGVFEHEIGRWNWGLDMRFERREYERTALVANFDQDYFYTGIDIDYALRSATTLRFGFARYRVLYDERPARDLTGALLTSNPAQYYDYAGAQVGVTQALGRAVSLEFDYSRVERTDRFVGYYDYSRDALRLRARFAPTDRFEMALGVVARNYDYPRAFAFHVESAGARELEEVGAELTAEYRATRRLALFATIDTLEVTSTDLRAEYSRARTTLGVEWRR